MSISFKREHMLTFQWLQQDFKNLLQLIIAEIFSRTQLILVMCPNVLPGSGHHHWLQLSFYRIEAMAAKIWKEIAWGSVLFFPVKHREFHQPASSAGLSALCFQLWIILVGWWLCLLIPCQDAFLCYEALFHCLCFT